MLSKCAGRCVYPRAFLCLIRGSDAVASGTPPGGHPLDGGGIPGGQADQTLSRSKRRAARMTQAKTRRESLRRKGAILAQLLALAGVIGPIFFILGFTVAGWL